MISKNKNKKEIDTRFKKFGTISFTSTTLVNDFIDYLKNGQIAGTYCKNCQKKFFPPRANCFICLKNNMEWFFIDGTGKIITYTQLMYAPMGFNEDLPYTIALADYKNFKIFGRIGNIPVKKLFIGMETKTEVNYMQNGQLNYVFNLP